MLAAQVSALTWYAVL